MAEETQPAAGAEVEKPVVKQAPSPPPEGGGGGGEARKTETDEGGKVERSVEKTEEEEEVAQPQSASFKEESNNVADLIDPEKRALEELKQLLQAAVFNNEFTKEKPKPDVSGGKPDETEKVDDVEGADKSANTETPKKEKEPTEAEEEPKTPPSKGEKPEPTKLKALMDEDDGAKTVEAIQETVVPSAATPPTPAPATEEAKEVSIWGVPLLNGGEKSDTILLKFLRARDFKVKEAFTMIKNTILWREGFGIEGLLEEDLGLPELEKVVFMHGHSREGHPVCYNVYGEFDKKELYHKVFGDEEKRGVFLRWRIQVLEREIKEKLDFNAEGVSTMVQVTDLKNSPGPGKKELRQATKQALDLLQDNYPEFVAKQIFINTPWWYMAFYRMIGPFLTQRTKSKFIFAGPGKSAETLFKYIAPEQVPVNYGGLSSENGHEFSTSDPVNEVTIKPSSKHVIEIPFKETCLFMWELRVIGWEISHGAEFVPNAEGGYAVVVQKTRKYSTSHESVVKNSFKIGEPGKMVLTIENSSSKKKKLLYRSKTKSC